MTNTQRNNLYIKIRYYLNKWKNTLNKGRLKDFKTDVFEKKYDKNTFKNRQNKIKKIF